MAKAHSVTEAELARLTSLASELTCRRCIEDRYFLRKLVRDYLEDDRTDLDDVVERCGQDPEHLALVVRDHLATFSESELLELLRRIAGVCGAVERLGFDPFDPRREEARRLGRRFINCREQQIALALGAGLFFLMCLVPPWKMERWQKPSRDACVTLCPQADRQVEVRFAGYHFAFTGPPAPEPPRPETGQYVVYHWYWEMQLLQWLGLAVVVVAACALLRDHRSFDERIAALEAERNGERPDGQGGAPVPPVDYSGPVHEQVWLDEQEGAALHYLDREGVPHAGRLTVEWCLAPHVSVWSLPSADGPAKTWVISGDLPTDYLTGPHVSGARSAVRAFAERWIDVSRHMLEGRCHPTIRIGDPDDPDRMKELGDLLRRRADLLLRWAGDDAVWRGSE